MLTIVSNYCLYGKKDWKMAVFKYELAKKLITDSIVYSCWPFLIKFGFRLPLCIPMKNFKDFFQKMFFNCFFFVWVGTCVGARLS